jgi:hypothetical protein
MNRRIRVDVEEKLSFEMGAGIGLAWCLPAGGLLAIRHYVQRFRRTTST